MRRKVTVAALHINVTLLTNSDLAAAPGNLAAAPGNLAVAPCDLVSVPKLINIQFLCSAYSEDITLFNSTGSFKHSRKTYRYLK